MPYLNIDGLTKLDEALARVSLTHAAAGEIPRRQGIAKYLAERMDGPDAAYYRGLTRELLQNLTVWWSPTAYAVMPTMVPWCVRDRSARYDQGPESWGAPNAAGYFRDDNSIIKKLPLPVDISAPAGHAYFGGRVHTGFTACHIWRELPDKSIAGVDPWLYSFMPNLVWMPRYLSVLSDRHQSWVSQVLEATSWKIFREAVVAESVREYADKAWARLSKPVAGIEPLEIETLAYFDADDRFVRRRTEYLDKIVSGTELLLEGRLASRRLISSRYKQGMADLDPTVVLRFRSELSRYRDAVGSSL